MGVDGTKIAWAGIPPDKNLTFEDQGLTSTCKKQQEKR